MTIENRTKWNDGKILWFEYIKLNGYNFTYDETGLKKLSKILDLNVKYIKTRLCIYLDN